MKLFLLLGITILSTTLWGQDQWTYLGNLEKTFAFWNESTYIYEESFQIKITSDGGNTSTTSSLMPGLLTPIIIGQYLDKDKLFLIQREGPSDIRLQKSTDGGLNFTDLGIIGIPEGYNFNNVFHIHFFNEQEGVLHLRTVNNGDPIDILIRTLDGGGTWDWAASIDQTDGAKDMAFSGTAGIKIFGRSEIYLSSDLGENWSMQGSNPLSVSGEFTSQGDIIWGVGDAGFPKPCNVISTDGGVSFSEWNIPDFAAGGFDDCGERIVSINETSLMVSGHENGFQNEVTLYSTDGGQTFKSILFPDDPVRSGETMQVTDDGKTYLYRSALEATWAFTPGSTTSTKNLSFPMEVNVYPNPSNTGIFNFSSPQDECQVFNQLGQQVYAATKNSQSIDLSHLTNGVYFIRFQTAAQVVIIE